MKVKVKIEKGGKVIEYSEETNTVNFCTSRGVLITCNTPKNWGTTRVVQFMESLLEADKNLI